jgi:DNA-binding CsgD family transcriptional regulator
LTEGQLACLRLVSRHLTSKQIARELGISKDTVDQRLDRARRTLGVANRYEAATALADFEGEYHRIVYEPGAVADAPESDDTWPQSSDGEERLSGAKLTVREEQAQFAIDVPYRIPALRFPIARSEEDRNDLTTLERLGWIAIIAIAVPVLLGSLIGGLWALGEIAKAVSQ